MPLAPLGDSARLDALAAARELAVVRGNPDVSPARRGVSEGTPWRSQKQRLGDRMKVLALWDSPRSAPVGGETGGGGAWCGWSPSAVVRWSAERSLCSSPARPMRRMGGGEWNACFPCGHDDSREMHDILLISC